MRQPWRQRAVHPKIYRQVIMPNIQRSTINSPCYEFEFKAGVIIKGNLMKILRNPFRMIQGNSPAHLIVVSGMFLLPSALKHQMIGVIQK